MMGQTSQPDLEKSLEFYKSFLFKLFNDAGEEICKFPVAVKNLTTAGVILEILHLDEGWKTDNFKGCEGILQIITQDDHTMIEVAGKILWTRNREGDSGVILGVELLEPMPMPMRHALEADMAIGSRDMKVLWDYWDEIQESVSPIENSEALQSAATPPKGFPIISEEQSEPIKSGSWWYWLGFGAIIAGLALQLQQSEYLGFFGLMVMFSGSLVIAMKSLRCMWQLASSNAVD